MIGFAAAFNSGLSSEEQGVPSKVTAALIIACVRTIWAGVTLLPIICEGLIFFTITAIFDVLFVVAWSSLTSVWNSDGTGTCNAFIDK